jgi:hypothetical protein
VQAELARLRATQAGFLERVEHLQMLLKVRLRPRRSTPGNG